MENIHTYLIATAATIAGLQAAYNVILQGIMQIRMEDLQQHLFSNKDVRERMSTVAQRDYNTLKSVRFNHIINFTCAMLIITISIINLSIK